MSRPRDSDAATTLPLNPAYRARLSDALTMLRRGAPEEEVRERHGLIVLREALEVISEGDWK